MKTIIRELIISLLVCIFVLIILSIMFYRFIPSNKVIPEKVTYQASSDVKQEVNSEVDDKSDLIVKTYEITADDIEGFERTDEYRPGKANPFAPVSTEDDTTTDDDNSTENSDSSIEGEAIEKQQNNNINIENSSSENNNNISENHSGGTLFENTSSK